MYYQIKVPTHHADCMRFSWLDEFGHPTEYILKVHVFGAKSSPSIANFALQQIARDNASNNEVANTIMKNFYVDDLLKSVSDEDRTVDLIRIIKETPAQNGFNLTLFNSNSEYIKSTIPSDCLSSEITKIKDHRFD
jgi:hypothetical protein